MRAICKNILLFWLTFCPSVALAQQTLLHSGGIGAGVCSGVAIHLTAPSDLTNGAWTKNAVNVASGVSDPFGGTGASSMTANSIAGGGFSTYVNQSVGTLSLNTIYAFAGYVKILTAPNWILFGFQDLTNSFANYFNPVTGAIGNVATGGGGVLTCATSSPAGNGYRKISIAGKTSAANTGMLWMWLADANGSANPTLNQAAAVFLISP